MTKKKARVAGGNKNPDGVATAKERRFCEEFIKDFNSVRAFGAAGYKAGSYENAKAEAWRLRQSPRVYAYLQEIQKDLERAAGISRLEILRRHLAIINTSIAHLHKSWITRTEFEQLTDEQKDVIQEIDTKTKTTHTPKGKKVEVEYVRIKLYDKQKALEAVAKMVGYNEPDKFTLLGDKKAIGELFPWGK